MMILRDAPALQLLQCYSGACLSLLVVVVVKTTISFHFILVSCLLFILFIYTTTIIPLSISYVCCLCRVAPGSACVQDRLVCFVLFCYYWVVLLLVSIVVVHVIIIITTTTIMRYLLSSTFDCFASLLVCSLVL